MKVELEARVLAGETAVAVAREAGRGGAGRVSKHVYRRWAREAPLFGARLAEARARAVLRQRKATPSAGALARGKRRVSSPGSARRRVRRWPQT